MSVPLHLILVKHFFRFAATKMRKLYEPLMDQIKIRDNCMWYFTPENNLMLHVLKTGQWDEYIEYITLTNQITHSKEIFEKLINEFTLDKLEPIEVEWTGKYFIVHGGCHRLALLMHKGFITDSIPMKWLSITVSKEIIDYLKKELSSTTGYNVGRGWNNRTQFGYQSLQIQNMNLLGQRNCLQRLNEMRSVYDFSNKKVMDLGCNIGGMLHHLNEAILGIGVDLDINSIGVAKKITASLGHLVLNSFFFSVNLETNHKAVEDLLHQFKPDVVFLLSIGSWVKTWKALYELVAKNVKNIFFEINNVADGQEQLELFKSLGWSVKRVNIYSSDDTTGNMNRILYFLSSN